MIRSLLVGLTLLAITPPLALLVVVASWLGIEDKPGSVYDWAPRFWASALCRAAGVHVRAHGVEQAMTGERRIFVSNHVSWYDVFAMASVLPYYKFVAKADLRKIPIFGPAMIAQGTVAIERENRKSAFDSYKLASQRIGHGASVVVYPEGTRGHNYTLRPFKKGPFVLAIAAGVPIVPTIIHGSIAVLGRGRWRIRPGIIDIHFLEPVECSGLTYEDRDQLSRVVYDRMADAFEELYGVQSPRRPSLRGASSVTD